MTMQGQEDAVFTEFSPDNKMMTPGFNTRVFTDVDSQRGNSIRCDFKTGAITLAPGSGGLTLSGGTQTLSGANTYTGATNVNAGTLQAGATTSFAQTSAFTI